MTRFVLGGMALLLVAGLVQAKDDTPANLIAGKKVAAGDRIKKGDRLVGVWERKNYLIEVLDIHRRGKLKVLWGGELYDDIEPTDLYYIGDDTPTRKKRTSPLPAAYQTFDKNGDGQIGLYEWDRSKYADFKRLDRNHDGFLTPQELAEKTSNSAASTSDAGSLASAPPSKDAEPAAPVNEPGESPAATPPAESSDNAPSELP